MKGLLFLIVFVVMACNNGETVTETKSSDSSMEAIDPKRTIRDTSQYPVDRARDSTNTGVTH